MNTVQISESEAKLEDFDEKISVEEIRSIVGRNDKKSEDSLVDPIDRLESERKESNAGNNNGLRIIVGLILTTSFGGVILLAASFYSKISGGGNNVVGEEPEKTTITTQKEESVNEEDRYKAKLAFAEQEADLQPQPQAQLTVEESETAIEPTPRPAPRPVTQSNNTDPLEEWAKLASLGAAMGNNEIDPVEPVAAASFSQTSSPRPRIEDTVVARTENNSVPSEAEELNRTITKGEVARIATTNIASVSIGESKEEDNEELTSDPLDINNPEIQNFLSDTPTIKNDYLAQRAEQFKEQERLAALASNGVASAVAQNSTVAPSAPVEQLQSSNKQIPFGTIVSGELSSAIIWSEGVDPASSRAKVVLNEPLLSGDGSIALDAGTILIVQVRSIQNSGLSELEAIAVSYVDNSGALKQEPIAPGAISIRGEGNSPLIADRANGSGGSQLGQDILMGVLGAGERGFEVLNERDSDYGYGYGISAQFGRDSPDREFDEFDGPYSYPPPNIYSSGSLRSTRNDDASLSTGAAEGVFETTKERLEERSEQIIEDRAAETPIYQINEGSEVSIFINSFLEINR